MKILFNILLIFLTKFFSCIFPYSFFIWYKGIKNLIYTRWLTYEFKSIGKSVIFAYPLYVNGGKFISIGNGSSMGKGVIISAWQNYRNQHFAPEIIIGRNVSIGEDAHITAINKIIIGDNVLFGKKVTITDNSHGSTTIDSLKIPPRERALISSGPVIIENNVWIGDKVTILSNVKIGENSIVGANSVVTKDIPPNCVAVGTPAKVIKEMN